MSETNSVIGIFLKNKRIENNLTQKDIANMFDLTSTQFISNWERGISLPPASYLPKLCKALNIEPKELIKLIRQKTDNELNSYFVSTSEIKEKKHGSK